MTILTAAVDGWPALATRVRERDGRGCVAPALDPSVSTKDCRDKWGRPAVVTVWPLSYAWGSLTLDHVHWHAGGTKGKKAPDDEAHLVTLCWHHHMDGWATSHRELEREYLLSLYGEERIT